MKAQRKHSYSSSLRTSVELRETIGEYAKMCRISANRWMELALEDCVRMCKESEEKLSSAPFVVLETRNWIRFMAEHPNLRHRIMGEDEDETITESTPHGNTIPTA